jgi:hypothetical protein
VYVEWVTKPASLVPGEVSIFSRSFFTGFARSELWHGDPRMISS